LTAVNGLGWPRSLDRTSLHREFPANRKNTGKFTKAGSLSGPERSNYPMFWGRSSELPIKSNRELLEGKQGNHFRTQGILLEIADVRDMDCGKGTAVIDFDQIAARAG
jgi:hypothetical protein